MHAYIISELKSRMSLLSRLINKSKHQNNLIDNLEKIYRDVATKNKHLSWGDFPDVEKMKVYNNSLKSFNFELTSYLILCLLGNIKRKKFFFFQLFR